MSSSALASGVRQLRGRLALQVQRDESDESLLHAFAACRDDAAFTTLVRRHGPMVLHVCRRVLGHQQDAEDAFQATFLVLARNAASLRNKNALASFLHGTAYRIALSAKRSAARRRKHEARTPARSAAHPSSELQWREVRTIVDEEIARLSEIYRSAFILCCLEQLSQAEAARRLHLSEGTLSSRLTEARKRLQRRLTRRGVELAAALAAVALTADSAPAFPSVLLSMALRTALPPSVIALADSAGPMLHLGKSKLAIVLLLTMSLLSGAGWWLCRAPAVPPQPVANPPTAASRDKPHAANTLEFHGRVLGADGKPKARAKLVLVDNDSRSELGTTAADGTFTVAVPKEAKHPWLIAQSDGSGSGFSYLHAGKLGKPVELCLVKDNPIRGRVVNTEGKALAGVRVAANDVNVYAPNSIDVLLEYWKNRRSDGGMLYGEQKLGNAAERLFATTTDADGRFVLRGVGVERLVSLRFRGAGIAEVERWIITRPGFNPKPYNQAVLDNTPKDLLPIVGKGRQLYGPDLSVIAEAEKILRGVLREADTGKGRPNVRVELLGYDGAQENGLHVQTDGQGRFEIHGARKAKTYKLEVKSDPATGYVGCQVHAEDTPGYQPITAHFTVKKGVIITGKMIDQASGKPIDCFVRAVPLNGNPFLKDYPRIDSAAWNSLAVADANGVFRVVAIPGPVLLMGGPRMTGADYKFKPSRPESKYAHYVWERPSGSIVYAHPGGGWSYVNGIFFRVLEIKPDAKVVEQTITLERLPATIIRMQDGEGKPLTHVLVAGLSAQGHYPTQFAESSCTAFGIEPSHPRVMLFYQPRRRLAATLTLKGDEKQPVVVKLGPGGALKGRLLDADGKPLAGVRVDLHYHHLDADTMNRCIHEDKTIETDAKGAFTAEDVLPGFKVSLSFRRGKKRFERAAKPAETAVQVKAGECLDLGAIELQPRRD